jgi:hypothetical protein
VPRRVFEGRHGKEQWGGSDIAEGIAKRLAADGARVAITYTKGADATASVVKAIQGTGGQAIAIQADATDADAVKAAVEKTVASFNQLDIPVNNAGVAMPKPFEETSPLPMEPGAGARAAGVHGPPFLRAIVEGKCGRPVRGLRRRPFSNRESEHRNKCRASAQRRTPLATRLWLP